MLPLLGQHVVDVRIHPVVGVGHCGFPEFFALSRQRLGLTFALVCCCVSLQKKSEEMNDAARIFVPKSAELAIGATRIEWKDRFEMRRLELGSGNLLGTEARDPDHADIAVA